MLEGRGAPRRAPFEVPASCRSCPRHRIEIVTPDGLPWTVVSSPALLDPASSVVFWDPAVQARRHDQALGTDPFMARPVRHRNPREWC